MSRDPIERRARASVANAYVYASDRPLASVDPSGMWREQVHRHDTYWATQVVSVTGRSFSPEAGRIIADSDQGVDEIYAYLGSDWHFGSGRWTHVWDEYQLALAWTRQRGRISSVQAEIQAWIHLGRALHALQDVHAHGDLNQCEHMLNG